MSLAIATAAAAAAETTATYINKQSSLLVRISRQKTKKKNTKEKKGRNDYELP